MWPHSQASYRVHALLLMASFPGLIPPLLHMASFPGLIPGLCSPVHGLIPRPHTRFMLSCSWPHSQASYQVHALLLMASYQVHALLLMASFLGLIPLLFVASFPGLIPSSCSPVHGLIPRPHARFMLSCTWPHSQASYQVHALLLMASFPGLVPGSCSPAHGLIPRFMLSCSWPHSQASYQFHVLLLILHKL